MRYAMGKRGAVLNAPLKEKVRWLAPDLLEFL